MCAEVTWNAEVSYIHLGSMAENLQFLSGKKKPYPNTNYHLLIFCHVVLSSELFHKIYKPTFLGFQFFSEVPYHASM